jgi:hypothetical protein
VYFDLMPMPVSLRRRFLPPALRDGELSTGVGGLSKGILLQKVRGHCRHTGQEWLTDAVHFMPADARHVPVAFTA